MTFFIFQAKDPLKAKVAKVIPTANNGSSELVSVHHYKVNVIQKYDFNWKIYTKASEEVLYGYEMHVLSQIGLKH